MLRRFGRGGCKDDWRCDVGLSNGRLRASTEEEWSSGNIETRWGIDDHHNCSDEPDNFSFDFDGSRKVSFSLMTT